MANVLPSKDRAALQRSYWLRLAITFTFVITAAMTIGSVSLIPAYLSARSEFNEATQYQEIQGETREAAKRDNAVLVARFVNAQIQQSLQVGQGSTVHAIEQIMRDWETHAADIVISGFDYRQSNPQGGNVPQMRISGEARNRAALNSFVQTLRTDSAFSDVSFPISDLVGEASVNFSITLNFQS